MASDEFNSGLSPARTGHPSLLQMLVQPEQVHGPEGSSQPGRELHPLLHFLPRTPVNVAVGQPRSSQSGDIGDKKTQRLGASPTEGQGLLSGLGLEPPSYSGDLFEVSSPSTPHDDREFNDGTACETSPKRVHLSPTRSRSPAKTRSGILPSVTSLLSPSKTHHGGSRYCPLRHEGLQLTREDIFQACAQSLIRFPCWNLKKPVHTHPKKE